jgi:hypothetical protein
VGCAQVLGLEEWSDPSFSAEGAGGTDTTSAGGGLGGAPETTGSAGNGGSGAATSASTTSAVSSSASSIIDAEANCADGLLNGMETDVDCGGDSCAPCALTQICLNDADCSSGNCVDCSSGECVGHVCGPPEPGCEPEDMDNPTCGDCVLNGAETGIDCGGDACFPCGFDKGCANGADCLSGLCNSGTCGAGLSGASCLADTDCASAQCGAGSCWLGTCCQ